MMNFTRNPAFARSSVLSLLLASFGAVQAQTDVIPSSVDLRLVQGATTGELIMQLRIHSSANFGGILSALTATIRYDPASGASLGSGTSFCNAWSAFTPTPVVLNAGIAYRTYNGFGINRLEDPVFDGGCATSLVPEEWFTITTIPVIGDGCTTFTLGNDAFTQQSNRNYYVSFGGHDVTGQVVGGSLIGGVCTPDCLGTIGGTALPGTPCDDSDPETSDDTWTADCVCIGTGCVAPAITGTSNNGPICSNNVLDLSVSATGSGPLTFAWTGPGTFSPDAASASVAVSGAASGTYQVTVANSCGDTSASIPIVVQQAPMATITYGGSPFCTSGGTANVTRTGSTGGTYSATPAGLSVNSSTGAITLGTSSAGTYTVTYGIAASGGCAAFSTTASVVINSAPSATISYSGSPYCSSGGTASVTRTGSSGGAYTAAPAGLSINGNTGTINLGNSTAGTYTVAYGIAASGGCTAFTATVTVVINSSVTWYADVDNDGVGDDASTLQACSQPAGYVAVGGDLCPTDPAKISPGACGCGIPDTDSDNDGIADCIDSCPMLEGEVGDACDDENPETVDDVITADCTCAGIISGIAEEGGNAGISFALYPNPNGTGLVFLDFEGLSTSDGTVVIEIHEVAGRLVHREMITPVAGKVHHAMDLSHALGRGLYMVQVIAGGHHYLQRLALQ